MNVKFLNPFVDAAADVLMAEAKVNINKGTVTLQKSALTTDEVTVLINLIGQVQGVVLFGLSEHLGMELVSKMMGQTFKEFDNLAQSGVAELGNVISGRATVMLSEAGYQSTISPPTMITGKGVQISTLDFPRIVVPLSCEFGDMVIHLALRESQAGEWNDNFVPLIKQAVSQK
jgi:chemotaxis protein CheX